MRWVPLNSSQPLDPIAAFRLSVAGPQNSGALWWMTLVEIADISLSAFATAVSKVFPKMSDHLIIPQVYLQDSPNEERPSRIFTIFARKDLIKAFNTRGNPFGVVDLEVGSAHTPDRVNHHATEQPGPPIKAHRKTVLTAVIDDGIAIANNLFWNKDRTTRIAFAYFMGGKTETPGFLTLGRSFSQAAINKALKRNTRAGLLDDDAFYRETGIIDFSANTFKPEALRLSHGTHILSIATGFPPECAPGHRPILCAALPSAVTADVSGQSLAPSLALALDTLLAESQRYQLPDGIAAPIVVNFSYGSYGDPHDGTSLIPRLLEQRFANENGQERLLTMPAGNGNLSRTHAKLLFSDREKTRHLRFHAQPDDRTASYVQLWLPFTEQPTPSDFATVSVTPPFGPQSPQVTACLNSGYALVDNEDRVLASIAYHFIEGATQRGKFLLSLNPTGSLDRCDAVAPSGLWQIDVTRNAIKDEDAIKVWVRRDETLPGYSPFGRQGYFDDPDYHRFDEIGAPLAVDPKHSKSLVRREGLFNGIATGKTPFVVAGLSQATGLLADYSSAGPVTPPAGSKEANRTGPDFAAPSDESTVRIGLLGASNRSGAFIRQNGTSVAAPMVARLISDRLAAGQKVDRAWLNKRATTDDKTYTAKRPAQSRVGTGRLRQDLPWYIS